MNDKTLVKCHHKKLFERSSLSISQQKRCDRRLSRGFFILSTRYCIRRKISVRNSCGNVDGGAAAATAARSHSLDERQHATSSTVDFNWRRVNILEFFFVLRDRLKFNFPGCNRMRKATSLTSAIRRLNEQTPPPTAASFAESVKVWSQLERRSRAA